jgi:hypothetical protein
MEYLLRKYTKIVFACSILVGFISAGVLYLVCDWNEDASFLAGFCVVLFLMLPIALKMHKISKTT